MEETCIMPSVYTCTARNRATDVASLMTPSPKTREYSSGILSCFSTCSTATLSVAAKMTPRAKQSYRYNLRFEKLPRLLKVLFKPANLLAMADNLHA